MSMFALNFTCCILKPLKMPLTNGNRIHQIKMMIWWHPNATQWGDGLASSNLKMMTYEGFMTHVILNIKCWWCWRQMSLKKRLCHDDLAVIVNDAAPCCGFDSNDVKWNISGYLRVQFEWCQVKLEWRSFLFLDALGIFCLKNRVKIVSYLSTFLIQIWQKRFGFFRMQMLRLLLYLHLFLNPPPWNVAKVICHKSA